MGKLEQNTAIRTPKISHQLTQSWNGSTSAERVTLIVALARTHRNVIDDNALGIRAANARTRVTAMLPNASHSAGTVRAVNALRSASGSIRIANIRRNAATLGHAIVRGALGILAARRPLTRIDHIVFGRNRRASNERIAAIAGHAITEGRMGDNVALGIGAARIRARVLAFLPYARLALRTVVVEDALGPAVWRRSNVVLDARAHRMALLHLANGAGSARRRRAWIVRLAFDAGGRHQMARLKRIARFAGATAADRIMVEHFAAGVYAAHAAIARVDALGVDARLVRRALGVCDAFGLTGGRVAAIVGQARAHGIADRRDQATAIGAAWRRIARVQRLRVVVDNIRRALIWLTRDHSVARMVRRTEADGVVVDRLALGAHAARSLARVHAFLVEARLVQVAVGADHALRPAPDQRVAVVLGAAHARQNAVVFAALGVGAALNGLAGAAAAALNRNGGHRAVVERVAVQALRARADGVVIDNGADGILAARPDARVQAVLVQARLVELAVRVGQAFGPAGGVVVAEFVGAHVTHGHAVAVRIAQAADGAGRRVARARRGIGDGRIGQAVGECVAHEARLAEAVGRVVVHTAVGVDAAGGRLARVLAASIDARLL